MIKTIRKKVPVETNSIADKVYYSMPRSLFDWKRKLVMALLPDTLREYPAIKMTELDENTIITDVMVTFDDLKGGSEPTIQIGYGER